MTVSFPFQTVLFWGWAIICSFPKCPVFRRQLSFLWVYDWCRIRDFLPPHQYPAHRKDTSWPRDSLSQTVQARKGLFSLLHAICSAKRNCKVCKFPCIFSIGFSWVCTLFFFFPNLLPSLVTMENEMPVPFKLSAE